MNRDNLPKGFRLLNFKISESRQIEKFENIKLDFSDLNIKNENLPFVTLIIGANATGKSRLLRVIVDVFNDLYNFQEKQNSNFKFNSSYDLDYVLNGNIIHIENRTDGLLIKKNNLQTNINNIEFPSKIIGASYCITDRFPHQANNYTNLKVNPYKSPVNGRYDNSFYHYLGVRTFNNMASATGHITRTIDLLINSYINGAFNDSLKDVFITLELKPVLSVEYRIKKSLRFSGEKKTRVNELKDYINNINPRNAGFSYKYYEELLNNESLQKEFLEYTEYLEKRSYGSTIRKNAPIIFDLNLEEMSSFDKFINEYRMLDLLRKLNIVGYGKVKVFRENGENFDINAGSSGEINLFTSLISMACVVKNDSLILIDEPEISLHPNWQMKYINLINSIFKDKYKDCHFIISTHSHFLVSDLNPNSSFILSLKYDNDSKFTAKTIPSSTFGWSAEQILLEVFKVPTTRNYYVAEKLGEILDLVSKPSEERNNALIRVGVQELIDYNLDKLSVEDPLHDVISKLIEKYGSN